MSEQSLHKQKRSYRHRNDVQNKREFPYRAIKSQTAGYRLTAN
jgi:hypothetical protein